MTKSELRALRSAAGLTQAAAAEALGVALRVYQHYEAGTRNIRAARARLAVRVLTPKTNAAPTERGTA